MSHKPRRPRSDVAVLWLARGVTITAAAKQSGCAAKTIRRWLDDPNFAGRVEKARADSLSAAMGSLSCAAVQAARTLRKLLLSKSDQVRLASARAILEVGPRMRELVELETRIKLLEENRNGKHPATAGKIGA